jgi:hypothetical protein
MLAELVQAQERVMLAAVAVEQPQQVKRLPLQAHRYSPVMVVRVIRSQALMQILHRVTLQALAE